MISQLFVDFARNILTKNIIIILLKNLGTIYKNVS